jgi:ribosomal protein S2
MKIKLRAQNNLLQLGQFSLRNKVLLQSHFVHTLYDSKSRVSALGPLIDRTSLTTISRIFARMASGVKFDCVDTLSRVKPPNVLNVVSAKPNTWSCIAETSDTTTAKDNYTPLSFREADRLSSPSQSTCNVTFRRDEQTEIYKDLLKLKAHIGNTQWTKNISPFLFGYRNNICIINIELTILALKQSLKLLQIIKKKNGKILFVNTSLKYNELIKQTALCTQQSYINDRWVSGSLTNWKQISQSIYLFEKFSFQFENFMNKNNIQISRFQKEKKRYEGLCSPLGKLTRAKPSEASPYISVFQSCSDHARSPKGSTAENFRKPHYIPDIIILTNPEENSILIEEAKKFQIPIITFIDTNNFKIQKIHRKHPIEYIIPVNNRSMLFMHFCCNLFAITLSKSVTM